MSAEPLSAEEVHVASPQSTTPRWMGRLCVGLFAIGILVTAIAWLLSFHASVDFGIYDGFATVAFFSRVFLWPIALGWLILGGLSLLCRRRVVGFMCVLFAVGWLLPELWVAWPHRQTATAPTFSVASFNLNREMKDATWAAKVMRQMNADFVALQELSPEAAAGIDHDLADIYPYRQLFPDTGFDGMGILSKTPLTVLHPPGHSDRRNFDVLATALGHELVLQDVHLQPPQWNASRRMNRVQVARIGREYASEARPMMLAGDFNFSAMTPNAFRLRSYGFQDAQLTVGNGRHTSWPAPSQHSIVPQVRIDTVYARGPLTAVGSEVGPDIGSDHLPIKTIWQWTN